MKVDNEPIAVGRTAEIYPYTEGKVLKLFFPTTPQAWIEKEIKIGRYTQDMQLPVPKVFESVEINNRAGIIYERVEGVSLLNELATRPWNVTRYGRLLAKLHLQIHQVQAPDSLETQRDWATGGIPTSDRLPDDMKASILQLLRDLPDGNVLCHGDFHPGNIIMADSGPMIIDWMTVSRGIASGDVARTLTILEAAKVPEGTPIKGVLEWIRKLFINAYLKTYLQSCPDIHTSLAGWQAVMASNFLSDVSIPGEEGNLLAIVERCLLKSSH